MTIQQNFCFDKMLIMLISTIVPRLVQINSTCVLFENIPMNLLKNSYVTQECKW